MKQNDASAAIQQQQAALLADLAAEQGCSTTTGVIAIDPLISAETSAGAGDAERVPEPTRAVT